jgi:protein-S-isoprenylcysteine O-methyltransferase Ste14
VNLTLRIPPGVWIAACSGVMWGVDRLAPLQHVMGSPANRFGWLLILAGAAIIATAVVQFRRARTTVDPMRPAKASALVRSGIFAYSRNPMYLGMAVGLGGWAVLLGSLSPWLVVAAFAPLLTWLQIQPEEAVLSALFGQDYDDYCVQVGRWFGRRRCI